MRNVIVEIAQQQAQAAIRRALVPAAIGDVALVFFLFALAALFAALFFLEEPLYGPRVSGADHRGGSSRPRPHSRVLFLIVGRRRAEACAAARLDTTLPQLVTLLAQSAPSVAPRQAAIAAALLALALGLMARGSSDRQEVTAGPRDGYSTK